MSRSFFFIKSNRYNNTQNNNIWPLHKIGENTIEVSQNQTIISSKSNNAWSEKYWKRKLNFLFLLNHKLKKIPEFAPAEEQVESIIKSVRECIDKHAPEEMKPISKSTNDWITNKIKNAITRKNTLFEKWINNLSSENQEKSKTIRKKVSALIREAKKK